jgi:DNA repair protein RadC
MKVNNPYYVALGLPTVREATEEVCRVPADIHRVVADTAQLAQECFTVLTLNRKYKLINRHMISLGIADATLVHPREIFRAAITDGASAIVLSHNHPSGDPTPSAEDLRITRQMVESGKLLDIEVLDHVIVGRINDTNLRGWLSLRESGLITFGI